MKVRDALRELAPPILWRMARNLSGRGLRFEGGYANWQDAERASGGYEKQNIVYRVYEAELKVKRGEVADARDGVAFDSMQFSLPIMAALGRIACAKRGPLGVLDFGGAFGGLYRQYKAFGLPTGVSWSVVEQPAFVSRGKDTFQNEELRFCSSMDEALANGPPDVILLSSVLQYLPQPYDLIRLINEVSIRHVIIDRTPCSDLDRDVLTIQKVPAKIYSASYPCWIFSRSRLLAAFSPLFRLVTSFADSSGKWRGNRVTFELAGFILDRDTPPRS